MKPSIYCLMNLPSASRTIDQKPREVYLLKLLPPLIHLPQSFLFFQDSYFLCLEDMALLEWEMAPASNSNMIRSYHSIQNLPCVNDSQNLFPLHWLFKQLKRVNKWLDDLVGGRIEADARIDEMRKKLYKFVLEHVDSTVIAGQQMI